MSSIDKINSFNASVDVIKGNVDPTKTVSSKFNAIKKHGKLSDLVRKIISAFMFGSHHLEQTTDKALFKQLNKLVKKCTPDELTQLKKVIQTYQDHLVTSVEHKSVAENAARVARKEVEIENIVPQNLKKMFADVLANIEKKQNAQKKPVTPEAPKPDLKPLEPETPPVNPQETDLPKPDKKNPLPEENLPPLPEDLPPPDNVPPLPDHVPGEAPPQKAGFVKVFTEDGEEMELPPEDNEEVDPSLPIPNLVDKTPLGEKIQQATKIFEPRKNN